MKGRAKLDVGSEAFAAGLQAHGLTPEEWYDCEEYDGETYYTSAGPLTVKYLRFPRECQRCGIGDRPAYYCGGWPKDLFDVQP